MRQNRRGMIINMGSLAGTIGLPFLAPYCASKFALAGLSEAMRYELTPYGIRVKLVELTGSRTQFALPILPHEPMRHRRRRWKRACARGYHRPAHLKRSLKRSWRIAGSSSDRLRYVVGAGSLPLGLRWLIPDKMVRSMLSRAFGLNQSAANSRGG